MTGARGTPRGPAPSIADVVSGTSQAADAQRLQELFGSSDVLPLWIAEPYLELAPAVRSALVARAELGWYGYEVRSDAVGEAFWTWMSDRHDWSRAGLDATVSPSVGTTIGVIIDRFTEPGDGVVIQPPVFTDFKPLIASAGRTVVKNPLVLADGRYHMDLTGLERLLSEPTTSLLVLCNPHNPVGRLWSKDELRAVAGIAADADVTVIADEIHADIVLGDRPFVPFAEAAAGSGVRWAAAHGPIKTFGLVGACDTLVVTADDEVAGRFRAVSDALHLTRNNVFGLAAMEAAYSSGGGWLDETLQLVADNHARVRAGLDGVIETLDADATYLAWLDLRRTEVEVPDMARWMGGAGVAMSPGHWFGREGAGFARMTIAAPAVVVDEAVDRLLRATER